MLESIETSICTFRRNLRPSRNGFSRERMGAEQAAVFDDEVRKLLLQFYPDGMMFLRVVAEIVWGIPANVNG
jgi:hypothetical protein